MVMISVVMAVLNRKDLVGQAISSVINQSYDDWELIIVDGGSTDGTLDIIKRYAALGYCTLMTCIRQKLLNMWLRYLAKIASWTFCVRVRY